MWREILQHLKDTKDVDEIQGFGVDRKKNTVRETRKP